MEKIWKKIEEIKLIPVVTARSEEDGIRTMKALVEGGLAAAEVTFRTEAAEDAIAAMTHTYPDALIGAGTVLNVSQAKRAIEAGAKFIVSPGFDRKVVEYCQRENMVVIPGCMTPTEMQYALACGLSVVKFFPAEAAGGIKMLKAVSAPYTGLRFMPTGGISEENVLSYLELEKVIACGGSWMVNPAKEGDYEEVCRRTKKAVSIINEIILDLKYYPAKNIPIHIEMLFPMWKKYMIEIGEEETDDDLLNGLVTRINIANSNENVYFDMIWSGNNAIGFAFYSIDGGIKGVIPPGYGYIMEFYIEDSWRRRCIGTGCVKHICERLNKVGCEKVYLTSIPESEYFWENSGFVKTDLIDPDNGLNIWLRNI